MFFFNKTYTRPFLTRQREKTHGGASLCFRLCDFHFLWFIAEWTDVYDTGQPHDLGLYLQEQLCDGFKVGLVLLDEI